MSESQLCMRTLYEHFMEELSDAENYFHLAAEHKRKNASLAKVFAQLGDEELKHAGMLEKEIGVIVTNSGNGDTNERVIHTFMTKPISDSWTRAKAAKSHYEM